MAKSSQQSLDFALDLYKHAAIGNDENIFLSPLNISLALVMTLAGAKENTAKQMKDVLKLASFDTDIAIHERFQEIMSFFLGSKSSAVELHIANRMYINNKTNVLLTYKTVLEKHYNTSVSQVDFPNETEKIRLDINEWVGDQTNNKITDMVAPGVLSAETCMALVNAIYFMGTWQKQFKPKKTTPGYFFLNENEAVMTELMHKRNKFNFIEDKNLKCKIVELRYVGEYISMFAILPDKVNGLKELEEALTAVNLNELISKMEVEKITLTFPKFKIECSLSVKDVLIDMGMTDLFNEHNADLSGISGQKDLCCSAVLHKAFLEVNEIGSEAAAATILRGKNLCERYYPIFNADHPFFVFIRDNRTEIIMFWGRLNNPNPNAEVETGPFKQPFGN